MASITIRNLDEQLKAQLRVNAAKNGRSMEEEVRVILRAAVNPPQKAKLGSRIRERFAAAGGIELELPSRADTPRDPGFDA